MLIRIRVRKPSDKICCWSIIKGEVGRSLIPMMHKLRTLLCRVSKDAAKLASNLLWPLVLPCWLLLLLVAIIVTGILLKEAPTISTVRLTIILVVVTARTSPPTSFSPTSMRRGVAAIKSSKCTLCSIGRGRVWRCGQQWCNSWNGLKRAPM